MIPETPRKHLTNAIEVWSGYAIDLADNGKEGDQRIRLMIAPRCGTPRLSFAYADNVEWLYLETNGDPVLVGLALRS